MNTQDVRISTAIEEDASDELNARLCSLFLDSSEGVEVVCSLVSGFKELNNAKNAKSCTSLNLVICARI